jgi:hypothetical protein
VFTRALHWSLSWARSIQSTPLHPISLRSILILFNHLHVGLPSGLFSSRSHTNILYAFLSPHSCYMPCPSHPHWLDHSNYTWRRVQVMKLLIMQFRQPPFTSSLFDPNTVLSTLFSNTLSLCTSIHQSSVRFKYSSGHFFKLLFYPSEQEAKFDNQRSRVRFLAPLVFLRSSGSGTGPTQPRKYNWGATWMEK